MAECLELLNAAISKDNAESVLFERQSSYQYFDNEVSWDGFESNLEEQIEEIAILQSIFPHEIEIYSCAQDNAESRNVFQLAVHIDLPHKPISVELWGSNEDENNCSLVTSVSTNRPESERPVFNRSQSGNRMCTSLEAYHITPVMLSVVFPETYPSQSSPIYSLSCYWLSCAQLTSLANYLDSFYNGNWGIQIVYLWADWLKTELFNHLQLETLIVMDESCSSKYDPRITLENCNAFSRFAEIITYDFTMLEKEFLIEKQTCQICFDEDVGSQFFRLTPCLHHYCIDCITRHCRMHVEDGTIGQLKCPEDECTNTISPNVLLQVLGDEEYMRWERLMLQRTLEKMGDVVWCPRCSNPVVRDHSDESLGICAVCMFSFCVDCNDIWHPGELCKELRTEDNKKLLKQQRTQQEFARADLQRVREEMYQRYQERLISPCGEGKKVFKNCPWCKVKIEKNGGCNKMTCRCGNYFCWLCGSKISGYDHFKSSGGCILFNSSTPRVVPTIDQVNFHDGYVAYRAALMQDNVKQAQCPRCRIKNVRTGRLNLVRCWFCKGHFCFQCCANLSKLNVPTSHYAANKTCLQHSD